MHKTLFDKALLLTESSGCPSDFVKVFIFSYLMEWNAILEWWVKAFCF